MTPEAFTSHFVWRGIGIAVRYTPEYFWVLAGEDAPNAHISIAALEPAGAPLPITETGYRSHFTYQALVAAARASAEG